MVDYADAEGIICCHENEKGIYGDTAERCLEVLEACEELSHLNAMQIGTLMAALADEGVVSYQLDEKRRKTWTLVG